MAIKIGDQLPSATFMVMGESGPAERSSTDVFDNRRVVLFGVPGAFTPSCHHNHMPGYVQKAADIRAKGIDAIACVSTNDIFVLDHWAEVSGAKGQVEMLADGNADFVKAIGLDLDASGKGLGTRSHRFAMLVENGTVQALEVESNPAEVGASSAESMLGQL